MDNRLLDAANGFMGRSSYEQREMNEMALGELEVDIPVGDEEEIDGAVDGEVEVDLDGAELDIDADAEVEIDGEEGEEPMMPIALAIRAMLLMNSEELSPEDALERVQAMDDGDAELEPDFEEDGEGEGEVDPELEPEDELAPDEVDETVVEEEEVVEEEIEEEVVAEEDDEEAGEPVIGEEDESEVDECDKKDADKEVVEEEEETYGESHSMFLKMSERYL